VVGKELRPLVICDTSGAPIDVVLENDKGFKKSIESGTLWSLHPDTQRLLPYTTDGADAAGVTIEDRGTWYRAVLGGGGAVSEDRASGSEAGRVPDNTRETTPGDESSPGGAMGAVLGTLVNVIRDRRREMPQGSYTTHLFTAGKEKIRKKAGEEAVELILASGHAELTSETADFLYHLLVLLEVEGVSLDEIAAELKSR
jgi:phosphoribosyl-AMP cyclohydrolase / phosphoribosyl-ATP pyrophosphohydrolase